MQFELKRAGLIASLTALAIAVPVGVAQTAALANVNDAPLTYESDKQRRSVVCMAVEKVLLPEFREEAKAFLLSAARDAVAAEFACALRSKIFMEIKNWMG